MSVLLLLILSTVVLWWLGHHLLAWPVGLAALSLVWPVLPGHLQAAWQAFVMTEFGQSAILYTLCLSPVVITLAWWSGWRPRYRRFGRPAAATAMAQTARSWVRRGDDPAASPTEETTAATESSGAESGVPVASATT